MLDRKSQTATHQYFKKILKVVLLHTSHSARQSYNNLLVVLRQTAHLCVHLSTGESNEPCCVGEIRAQGYVRRYNRSLKLCSSLYVIFLSYFSTNNIQLIMTRIYCIWMMKVLEGPYLALVHFPFSNRAIMTVKVRIWSGCLYSSVPYNACMILELKYTTL